MKLCVGAASRRVVEEAADLGVAQIVASRRQVGEFAAGYTGYTSATLVQVVKDRGGVTQVVRDHGGPFQNGDRDDNWVAAFDADVDAGFDVLHLDVSKLPANMQCVELTRLCERYRGKTGIEVGGERDRQAWLDVLLKTALGVCQPQAAVAAFGGHIWADRQCGQLVGLRKAKALCDEYAACRVDVKAHNLDWMGGRWAFLGALGGFANVAPEFGNVEIDAWLHVLPHAQGQQVLYSGYASGGWRRWFGDGEGTWLERARAGLRYQLESPAVAAVLNRHDDTYVREAIRDAISHG